MASGVDAIINERRPAGGTSDVAAAEGSIHESSNSGTTDDGQNGQSDSNASGGGEPLVSTGAIRHSDGALPFQKRPKLGDVKMDSSDASDILTSASILLSVI